VTLQDRATVIGAVDLSSETVEGSLLLKYRADDDHELSMSDCHVKALHLDGVAVIGAGDVELLGAGGSSGSVQAAAVKATARTPSAARRIVSAIEAPLNRCVGAGDTCRSVLLDQFPVLLIHFWVELGDRTVDGGEVPVVKAVADRQGLRALT
jgi:hypothetical protein